MKINDAISALRGDVTCVVIKGECIKISTERGIKPLIAFMEVDPHALCGAIIADKIIGRAAALLAVYGGAAEVYGEVMTDGAMDILSKNGIKAQRKVAAEHIINRRGDGICPMEAACANINDAEKAYNVLREKISK